MEHSLSDSPLLQRSSGFGVTRNTSINESHDNCWDKLVADHSNIWMSFISLWGTPCLKQIHLGFSSWTAMDHIKCGEYEVIHISISKSTKLIITFSTNSRSCTDSSARTRTTSCGHIRFTMRSKNLYETRVAGQYDFDLDRLEPITSTAYIQSWKGKNHSK